MKILPVETEFFHADGRTDRQTDTTKLIVAFHNFAKAHINYINRHGVINRISSNVYDLLGEPLGLCNALFTALKTRYK
jgi:hypothetical protein